MLRPWRGGVRYSLNRSQDSLSITHKCAAVGRPLNSLLASDSFEACTVLHCCSWKPFVVGLL